MDKHWNTLFKIGGISGIIIAILLIGEGIVYSLIPNPETAEECLNLFKETPLLGLLHFDLLGMISYLLLVPLILSLYIILRKNNEAIAIIASVLFFVGIAVFFANNTAFSLLSISKNQVLTDTGTDKTSVFASVQTLNTLFDVQAFMISYIIVSLSWLLFGLAMIKSALFTKFVSYTGIIAGAAGIVAEILENSATSLVPIAIGFYFAAILFLFIWVVLISVRLNHLSGKMLD